MKPTLSICRSSTLIKVHPPIRPEIVIEILNINEFFSRVLAEMCPHRIQQSFGKTIVRNHCQHIWNMLQTIDAYNNKIHTINYMKCLLTDAKSLKLLKLGVYILNE